MQEAARVDAPLLEARGLVKRFGSFVAVAGVEFELAADGFVTLLGPSGCGKTTILRLIGGFERPSDGQIFVEGIDITDQPAARRPVNTVFQSYALFPHLSVFENVAFGLRLKRLPDSEIHERTMAALATVRLEDLAERFPRQISGGQQQRIAVARAIVNRPRLLLLDEPLGALDLKMRRHLQVELKTLQRQLGTTFLYVTHDQEEAFAMSDRIIVMNAGRIEQADTPEVIYRRPANAFVADFIDDANLVPGRVSKCHAADRVTLDCELGSFIGNAVPGLQEGDAASLCFRREEVLSGAAAAEGAAARFDGHVRTSLFEGASRRIAFDVRGLEISVEVPAEVQIEPGAKLQLGLADRSIWIVRGHPRGAEE